MHTTRLLGGLAAVAVAALALAAPTAQAGPLQGTSALGWADDPATAHVANVVGDVNGDGFDDLAFGEGTTLRIVAGSRTGVNVDDVAAAGAAGVLRLDLPEPVRAVDAAGDFDGDGVDDLLVVFRRSSVVYYGVRGPLGSNGAIVGLGQITTITAPTNADATGQLMSGAGIGDFNGDGKDDVVVTRAERHLSIVYGGARTDTLDAKTKTARVSLINSHVECVIFIVYLVCRPNYEPMASAVGDINGDGLDDLAIDGGVAATVAKRYVLFGRPGSFSTEIKAPSNAMQLPRPMTASYASDASMPVRVGDLNGDGRDELHSREFAPPGNANGTRYVFGMANPPSSLDVATAPSVDLAGGYAARSVGDANGDGRRDFAFLAPSTWTAIPENRKEGELRLATAPTGAGVLNAADATPVKGLPFGELLGSGAGDFDGDGQTDIALATTDAFRNPGSTEPRQLYFVATRGADVAPPQLGPVSIGTPRFIGAQGADLFVSVDETDTAVEIVYQRKVGDGFAPEATERRAVQRGVNTLRIKDLVGSVRLPVGDYRAEVRPIDPAGNRGAARTVNFTLFVDGPETPTDLPTSLADFTLSGDAAGSGNSVNLLTGDAGVVGTAVYPVKRDFNGRTFEFDVDIFGAPPEGGAQGLAMGFISAEPNSSGEWLGRGGDQLGIGGLGGFSFAWDVSKGPNDPSDNFIGWSPGTLGQGMQWVHTNGSGIARTAGVPLMQGSFKVTFLNKRLRVYVNGVLRMDRAALVPLRSRLAFTAANSTLDGGIIEVKNLKVS